MNVQLRGRLVTQGLQIDGGAEHPPPPENSEMDPESGSSARGSVCPQPTRGSVCPQSEIPPCPDSDFDDLVEAPTMRRKRDSDGDDVPEVVSKKSRHGKDDESELSKRTMKRKGKEKEKDEQQNKRRKEQKEQEHFPTKSLVMKH